MSGRRVRASNLAVASNVVLMASKAAVGVLMSSVTIISLAADSFFDLLGSVLTNYSLRKAEQPPDESHQYGHWKYENLAGAAQATLIFLAAGVIMYEAARRLFEDAELAFLDAGIAVLLFSTVVDLLVSRYLHRVSEEEDSIALEADSLHLSADVLANLGTVTALVVIRFTGWDVLDALIGILIALYIVRSAWQLIKRASGGLLDESLPPGEEAAIRRVLREHAPRYYDYHRLRTRKAGPWRFVDLHLIVDRGMTVEESHDLAHEIEEGMREELGDVDVLIHVEPWTSPSDR